jgi:hypothetical protein
MKTFILIEFLRYILIVHRNIEAMRVSRSDPYFV